MAGASSTNDVGEMRKALAQEWGNLPQLVFFCFGFLVGLSFFFHLLLFLFWGHGLELNSKVICFLVGVGFAAKAWNSFATSFVLDAPAIVLG